MTTSRAWSVPGVTAVTPTLIPPFYGTGVWVSRVDQEGQTPEEMKSNPMIPVEVGGAEYFRVHGIPITRGRAFTDKDDDKSEQIAVVSESAARRLWPNADPIGKRIRYWNADMTGWRTVVGVAGDIHYRTLREATAV